MLAPPQVAYIQLEQAIIAVKGCLTTAVALGAVSANLQPLLLQVLNDVPKTFAVLAAPLILSTSPPGSATASPRAALDASSRIPLLETQLFDIFDDDEDRKVELELELPKAASDLLIAEIEDQQKQELL